MSTMSIRNLTWQQAILCVALLGAVVLAYKLFGELPAGVLLVLSGIVNLLLGRNPPRPPSDGGAAAALLIVVLGCAVTVACATVDVPGDVEMRALSTKLARCRAEGRDAGSYATYERCKEREGIAP
jgi:hypothetical protein